LRRCFLSQFAVFLCCSNQIHYLCYCLPECLMPR